MKARSREYDKFENGTSWSVWTSSAFPATSVWRGNWGIAAPRSGAYAYAISNLADGWVESDPVTVAPNTIYDLSAYVRGGLDGADSGGEWILRANLYDSQDHFLTSVDTALVYPDTLTASWQLQGGEFTTTSATAKVRLQLFDSLTSGWVAFDDVTLAPANITQYYYAAGQRVAMRQDATLYYLLGDVNIQG